MHKTVLHVCSGLLARWCTMQCCQSQCVCEMCHVWAIANWWLLNILNSDIVSRFFAMLFMCIHYISVACDGPNVTLFIHIFAHIIMSKVTRTLPLLSCFGISFNLFTAEHVKVKQVIYIKRSVFFIIFHEITYIKRVTFGPSQRLHLKVPITQQ